MVAGGLSWHRPDGRNFILHCVVPQSPVFVAVGGRILIRQYGVVVLSLQQQQQQQQQQPQDQEPSLRCAQRVTSLYVGRPALRPSGRLRRSASLLLGSCLPKEKSPRERAPRISRPLVSFSVEASSHPWSSRLPAHPCAGARRGEAALRSSPPRPSVAQNPSAGATERSEGVAAKRPSARIHALKHARLSPPDSSATRRKMNGDSEPRAKSMLR